MCPLDHHLPVARFRIVSDSFRGVCYKLIRRQVRPEGRGRTEEPGASPGQKRVMSTSTAPTSAAAVANEFLQLAWEEKGVPPTTPMKLQKLLYYAHAWYLALHDCPLFVEDIEAWPWGPVQRDVYFDTLDHGRLPVVKFVSRLALIPGKPPLHGQFETPKLQDKALKEFIKQVWDVHKGYTAIQLSNSTHAEGEPWAIIKEQYGSLERKPTIPNDLIAQVFKKKLADAAASGRATYSDRSDAGEVAAIAK
jgi:uncharacterized phage-associated protein